MHSMPYIELKSGTSDISTRYGTAKFLSFSAVDTNTCTHNDMNTHIHTHTHTHTYVHVSFILNQRCTPRSLLIRMQETTRSRIQKRPTPRAIRPDRVRSHKCAYVDAHLVHSHARFIPVVPEAHDDDTVLLAQYGLVHLYVCVHTHNTREKERKMGGQN